MPVLEAAAIVATTRQTPDVRLLLIFAKNDYLLWFQFLMAACGAFVRGQ